MECIMCGQEGKGLLCSTKCGIKYYDNKYKERKHFNDGYGWYFKYKRKKDFEIAKKEGFDTSFYSGVGCILNVEGKTKFTGVLYVDVYKKYLELGYLRHKT